jgi:hypothetical protein
MISHQFLSAYSRTLQDCKSLEEVHWFSKHLLENKLSSKKWLVDELLKITNPINVLLLGSWYATYLPYALGKASYTCVDIDPSVVYISERFNHYLKSPSTFKYVTADAKGFIQANQRYYDIVINTSCEHMPFDMKDVIWDRRSLYVFQSNNYLIEEHVNPKNSLQEFIDSTGLSNIHYAGISKMSKYDRYMVIGKL